MTPENRNKRHTQHNTTQHTTQQTDSYSTLQSVNLCNNSDRDFKKNRKPCDSDVNPRLVTELILNLLAFLQRYDNTCQPHKIPPNDCRVHNNQVQSLAKRL